MSETCIPPTYRVDYVFDADGNLIRETTRNQEGDLDRLGDQPAVIDYCPQTGKARRWEWWRNSMPHRDGDEPAILEIDPRTGQERARAYWKDGQPHSAENRFTSVRYAEDGSLLRRSFFVSGQLHRTDGPAEEYYNEETGALEAVEFWLDGIEVEPF